MTHRIEDQTRQQIAEILPQAIHKAMESYQLFLNQVNTEDAKAFKAHHDACKVAIAHVELLIRLARWADVPDQEILKDNQKQILLSLIEDAKSDISSYEEEADDA